MRDQNQFLRMIVEKVVLKKAPMEKKAVTFKVTLS